MERSVQSLSDGARRGEPTGPERGEGPAEAARPKACGRSRQRSLGRRPAAGPARGPAQLWGGRRCSGVGCVVGAASSWETRLGLGGQGTETSPLGLVGLGK